MNWYAPRPLPALTACCSRNSRLAAPVPHPIRSRSAFTAQARPRRRERGPATEEQALVAHRKRVARQEDHRNKRHCRGIQSFFRAARPRDEPQLIG